MTYARSDLCIYRLPATADNIRVDRSGLLIVDPLQVGLSICICVAQTLTMRTYYDVYHVRNMLHLVGVGAPA